MNVIAMKNGKSKLINELAFGKTIVVNMTNTRMPFLSKCIHILDLVEESDICVDKKYKECFRDFSDLDAVKSYDTVIFYSYDTLPNAKLTMLGIYKHLGGKNTIFMLNEF